MFAKTLNLLTFEHVATMHYCPHPCQMPLLMGVPGAEGNLDAMLEDDAGLEAELADLVGGGPGGIPFCT